jgi:transglutaminase-like putative cysteine protease
MRLSLPLKNRLTVTLASLPNGVAGIRETLELMVRIARSSKNSFIVRQQAMNLVAHVKQKAWLDEVRAIHEYVRDVVRYVKDINGVETLATPEQTLRMMQGDCDDKSLLTASLLEAIGHPTRFVAVATRPGDYEHVLVETRIGNKWIPVETTEPVPVGWYPPNVVQRMVYHV